MGITTYWRWLLGGLLGVALMAPPAAPAHIAHQVEVPSSDGKWLVRTWESEDGLPENSATAMVQTPDHYLWFGTFNGLVRFDGVRFTVYDAANAPGLPSSGIVSLHLDRAGRLWVGTLRGLVWRERGLWAPPPGVAPEEGDVVRSFAERPDGDLLLTTFRGELLEFSGGSLRKLPSPPGIAGQGYVGSPDADGTWWVVQHGFVGRWKGGAWERMIPLSEMPVDSTGFFMGAPAREGGLWVLMRTELRRYFRGREVARRRIPDPNSAVWSFFEDRSGTIWVCTIDRGVLEVSPDGSGREWNEETGISYHGARFAFEDREGNLWIGTSGGGLMRFKPRRFATFGPDQGLEERVVKTVWPAPDGGLWMGTYGKGLFRLGERGIRPVPIGDPDVSRRYVQSVLTDRGGLTWVGTFGNGLYRFGPGGGEVIPKEQTRGHNIIAIFEDSRGWVWVSGGSGITVFDQGAIRQFGPESGLPDRPVYGLGEGADGTVWATCHVGVFRWVGERWDEVRTTGGEPLREITCFRGESDGTMWMGSLGNGLVRWRSGRDTWVTQTNGFPVRGISSILVDDRDHFWMASSQGIVRSDRRVLNALADGTRSEFEGQLLDRSDGLESAECPGGQQPTAARDQRGRLWFATLKGVALVDPATFRTNPVAPPALVEELAYFVDRGSEAPGISIERRLPGPFSGPVDLPPGSHRLAIHYTAASFTAPEKVRFQYRLGGADGVWREGGANREAHFENLQPGLYRFRVRAANDDGLWSREPAELAFRILPFFWQTDWFRGLGIVVVVGVIAAWGLRVRSRLVRRHAAQVDFTRQLIASQEGERARLARELHDDLTQRLARLAIDAGQAEHTLGISPARQALVEMREGLVRLSEDVHALSYRLHPSILEDLGLTEALKAEGERLSRRTDLSVAVKVNGVPDLVPRDPALCLFRIAEEALQNVLRHARAQSVEVSLRGFDGGLQLAVQDDGKGFDVEAQRRQPRLGLTGMRERVDLLGGQLDIESAPGEGTLIVAWLPLKDPPA